VSYFIIGYCKYDNKRRVSRNKPLATYAVCDMRKLKNTIFKIKVRSIRIGKAWVWSAAVRRFCRIGFGAMMMAGYYKDEFAGRKD
jgi:hypothetical protein